MSINKCRFCGTLLKETFVDLGMHPLSNAYIKPGKLNRMEPFYPLHAFVCSKCFLVQIEEFESPEAIFSDYAYFSSYSDAWLKHCENYVESMIGRFGLNNSSKVIEIASNDGYLLQYFNKKKIPILGIEPAQNVAKVAREKGIPTEVKFFGVKTANELLSKGTQADLLLGNNVLAHVPDLNDFVAGMKIVLKKKGIITMEFPHLLCLMEKNQFDTIYHEHFSYFSFVVVESVFAKHGITLFDVEELATHGGSLRIYGCHDNNKEHLVSANVEDLKMREINLGLDKIDIYQGFSRKVNLIKCELLEFLIQAQKSGKSVVGYGAAAKGNTLLNYCGIGTDFISYVVDRSPHKQECYLPGTHIPICSLDKIKETRPDYVLILPWNLKDEIMSQMAHIREWGSKFVVPIPHLEVLA